MAESSDLLSVPLRRRMIASRRTVSSAGVTEGVIPCSNATSSCGRPQKKWANEPKLKLALNELQKPGKSIRSVATEYDIPNSTLHDYASGRLTLGAHQGPQRYLSDVEEEALVSFVLYRMRRRRISENRKAGIIHSSSSLQGRVHL